MQELFQRIYRRSDNCRQIKRQWERYGIDEMKFRNDMKIFIVGGERSADLLQCSYHVMVTSLQ